MSSREHAYRKAESRPSYPPPRSPHSSSSTGHASLLAHFLVCFFYRWFAWVRSSLLWLLVYMPRPRKPHTKKVKTVYKDLEPVNVGMQSESNWPFGHEYFQKVSKCVATTVLVKVLYLVCISQLLQRQHRLESTFSPKYFRLLLFLLPVAGKVSSQYS